MSYEDHYDPDYPPTRADSGPVALDEYLAPTLERLQRKVADPAYQRKVAAEIEASRRRAEAAARRNLIPALCDRGVPLDFAELIWAGVNDDYPCMRILRDTTEPALVFSGGTGVGKSLAAAVWVAEGGRDARFISAQQLSALTRSRIDRATFERLCRISVLAIDDVGTEVDDDRGSFRARFDSLLGRRMCSKLRTVITTNLPAAQFRHSHHGYGERIWSRLHQYGRFEHVDAPDLRLAGPQ